MLVLLALAVGAVLEAVRFLAAARAAAHALAPDAWRVCCLVAQRAERLLAAGVALGAVRSVVAGPVAPRAHVVGVVTRVSHINHKTEVAC